MNEIKIRSDNRISVGANIKRIRQAKGIRAYDLIRELQLQGLDINKQRYKNSVDVNKTADRFNRIEIIRLRLSFISINTFSFKMISNQMLKQAQDHHPHYQPKYVRLT